MRIVVANSDPDWSAPLSAMLRERGFDVAEVDDVLEAMSLLGEPTVGLVVNTNIGCDEALLTVKAVARRFSERIQCVGVGSIAERELEGAVWCENPYHYVHLVETLTSRLADPNDATRPAPGTAEVGEGDPFTIETLGDVSRLLHTARFEPYFELLRVDREADDPTIQGAASGLRDALDEEAVPAHVVDVCYEELAEVRAAVDDAEAVLTSRPARVAYLQGLASGA